MTLRLSGHFSVSSGNCETMESSKICNLTLKPRILFSISNVGYDCNSMSPGHSLGTGEFSVYYTE